MKRNIAFKGIGVFALFVVALSLFSSFVFASEGGGGGGVTSEQLVSVQVYNRAIHVLAMAVLGFGFLMAYVRRYGYSGVTATLIVVSISMPMYIYLKGAGYFGGPMETEAGTFLFADFAAISLLICVGAPLGRLKMKQYVLLALLFIPCYMLNEWITTEGGLGFIAKGSFVDTGGSVIIHAFGAYFGLGVIVRMTTKEDFVKQIDSSKVSNQFCLIGTLVLWLFWPSFCAGILEPAAVPHAAVNTLVSLCGATLTTYLFSVLIRKKIEIADIANAALAGGVVIGSTCAHATHKQSLILGLIAGALSVIGFAIIQPKLQKIIKGVDTCGVHNLHGMPGLLGGFSAMFIVQGLSKGTQFKGMVITVIIALIAGLATGTVLSLFGHRKDSYNDAEEFIVEEGQEV